MNLFDPLPTEYDQLNLAGFFFCEEQDQLALAKYYMSRLSHRGTCIKFLGDLGNGSRIIPKGIDAREWSWKVAISAPWRYLNEHINYFECQAYRLALKWRLRHLSSVRSRFVHLLDSGVVIGICSKGRTSSSSLRRALLKVSSLALAGHLCPILGFVRSHLNPSDRPSRFFGHKSSSASSAGDQSKCAARRQRRGG